MNNTQVYPVFGNHECFPADFYDFYSNQSESVRNNSARMWDQYLDK